MMKFYYLIAASIVMLLASDALVAVEAAACKARDLNTAPVPPGSPNSSSTPVTTTNETTQPVTTTPGTTTNETTQPVTTTPGATTNETTLPSSTTTTQPADVTPGTPNTVPTSADAGTPKTTGDPAPSSTTPNTTTSNTDPDTTPSSGGKGGCSSPVKLDATTNVWTKYKLHPNNEYRAEVEAAAKKITDAKLATAAKAVGNVGTFLWLDTIARIAKLEPAIADVPCENILGVVIYDLPGRDCAASASNGELKPGDLDKYKGYIDAIAKIIKAHPNTAFALVIEPDSLPNLVTNSGRQTCAAAAADYRAGVPYAIKTLNFPNVVMYLDAGHGGWLGWDANLKPGAAEIAKAYLAADKPSQVRGISSNVAGWNSFDQSPGEFSSRGDGQSNKAQNEKLYIGMIAPELKAAGMPNHAIVDTGRNGVTGLRQQWGDWCNVKGAGFGPRPTSETGSDLVDALVWVKPGGESDGTSNSSATRFDAFCSYPDAFQPSPQAGTWNQAYFEELVKNAKPPLA